MKIAFVSEGGFQGKVPRTYENMRTDLAWINSLDANHYPFFADVKDEKYDYVFVIFPKKYNERVYSKMCISWLRTFADKIIYLQEGPNNYWQEYEVDSSIIFYNLLTDFDAIACHNQSDVEYYKGLSGIENVFNLQSLMITEHIDSKIDWNIERKNIIIGGTLCQWYNGMDSFHVARYSNELIYAPSMGRKTQKEELFGLVKYLPYLDWNNWILTLNSFKYGVHLMRTFAAGTFAMNCAYLGIPCIGYDYVDTQRILHPELSVKLNDLKSAVELMKRLRDDDIFYNEMSLKSKQLFKERYSEEVFLEDIKNKIREI